MPHSSAADISSEIEQAIVELGVSIRRERRRKLTRISLGIAVMAFVALAISSLEYHVEVLAGAGR